MKTQWLLSIIALLAGPVGKTTAQVYATNAVGLLSVQGVLYDSGQPANGFFDWCWFIYDTPAGGQALAHDTNMNTTLVSNGLANVTYRIGHLAALNLSPTQELYLEIDVRRTGSADDFTVLGPRQRIVPALLASLAVRAEEARRLIEPLTEEVLPWFVPRLDRSATFQGTLTAIGDLGGGRLSVGSGHQLAGASATIAGGMNNTNLADRAAIGGGEGNAIEAAAVYGTIGGGGANRIGYEETTASALGLRLAGIGTGSTYGTIGGGYANNIGAYSDYGTVAGGFDNDIRDHTDNASLGGGYDNDIASYAHHSTIGGGTENDIGTESFASTIGGGNENDVQDRSPFSTISGGDHNNIMDDSPFGVIAGGEANLIRINARHSAIGGGWGNEILNPSPQSGAVNTIAGGKDNYISAQYAFIGGGYDNRGYGLYSLIVGGQGHVTRAPWSSVGGGRDHYIDTGANHSAIASGLQNRIWHSAESSVIAGGKTNYVGTNSSFSAIGGGFNNRVLSESEYATIPGGRENQATNYAFAAGHHARAMHLGSFVWNDSVGSTTSSFADNSVTFRARGGIRMFSSGAGVGAELVAGSGSWTSISDRNAKENFQPVDARSVLDKVAALPVAHWNYRTQDASVRHIGPTAQDFRAAFAVGDSATGITTVDADGVALAAIQGLNQKLEEQLQAKDAEIQELKTALSELMGLRHQVQELAQRLAQGQP